MAKTCTHCNKPAFAKGKCTTHYQRARRGQAMDRAPMRGNRLDTVVSVCFPTETASTLQAIATAGDVTLSELVRTIVLEALASATARAVTR